MLLLLTSSTAFLCPAKLPFRTRAFKSVGVENLGDAIFWSGNVTVLDRKPHYLVVSKPPSVVCHHSDFTGSRGNAEVPILQRVLLEHDDVAAGTKDKLTYLTALLKNNDQGAETLIG